LTSTGGNGLGHETGRGAGTTWIDRHFGSQSGPTETIREFPTSAGRMSGKSPFNYGNVGETILQVQENGWIWGERLVKGLFETYEFPGK